MGEPLTVQYVFLEVVLSEGSSRALLYSPDGEDWLIQEMDRLGLHDIKVLEDRIVVTTTGSWLSANNEPPPTAIWVGTLP